MKKISLQNKKTLVFISVFFCCIIFIGLYVFYPVINYNKNIEDLPGRLYITDRYGNAITDKARKNGYYKKYKYLGETKFIGALFQIEDKNFHSHYGINILSKFRAIKDNILGRTISGGSTLTEQYIKNKYFRGEKRNYVQKIREAVLAVYFSMKYSKQEILENYLNTAYFGNHIYGIAGALEVYFDKESLDDLQESEIVLLLTLLHSPSTEFSGEKYFLDYQTKVKSRLGYDFEIEKVYLKKFKKKNIEVFPFVTKRVLEEMCWGKKEEFSILKTHPSFLLQKEGKRGQCSREVVIQSTVDSRLQKYARELLNQELDKLSGKNVTNGAIFGVLPETKEILVYQGSRDFYSQKIDGEVDVIQSKRQPGSTVKPFLYLMAMKSGYNPDDLLLDVESEYNSFQKGKSYVTENYSLREYGLVRLKKALGNSLNNATVRLASELGLENVYDSYIDNGFQFDFDAQHYGYSLVLGNAEIKLENLVESYSKLLVADENNLLLESILRNPNNRDISFGVNSILNTTIPQAVKTGTSSDFRDNTIVSYSRDLLLAIWVGNNDNSSMIGVTGISGAGRVWHDTIEEAISLGYIDSEESFPSLKKAGVEEGEYCLDKNCFRKEIIYHKVGKKYYSRIGEGKYSQKDILQKMSNFELKKIGDMGIEISE